MSDETKEMLKKLLAGQEKIKEEINRRMDALSGKLEEEVGKLQQENAALKSELSKTKAEAQELQQYLRAKNVIFYEVPGVAKEDRETSQKRIEQILSVINCGNRVTVAHRLNPSANSPIVAVFESKCHAQEVMEKVRRAGPTVASAGFADEAADNNKDSKIMARAHLCKSLGELLKAATALKTEANWGWTKVITSSMLVEIYQGKDSDGKVIPPVKVRSIEDVKELRDLLVAEGKLPKEPPAALQRQAGGKGSRKRDAGAITPESNRNKGRKD